jgi:hypothetical protein
VRQPDHMVRQPDHTVRQPDHMVRQPDHTVRQPHCLAKVTTPFETSRVFGNRVKKRGMLLSLFTLRPSLFVLQCAAVQN